jgi:ACS family sodium-dependent inorganic phosphate cotransporter-like MFS transporter 5
MSFLGFVNVYCLRVNLSVAMVSMVNSSYAEKTSNVSSDECPGHNVTEHQPEGNVR